MESRTGGLEGNFHFIINLTGQISDRIECILRLAVCQIEFPLLAAGIHLT